ncbi:TPR-like protein [Nemania serpens]|nr:TPR-like protein [Nemania serpens]
MSVQGQRAAAPDLPAGSGVAIEASFSATTNYGAQIAYNYGSISNYFCSHDDGAHQCHFPDISSKNDSDEDSVYKKIKRARELYSSKRWNKAKVLFLEVLSAPYATLASAERVLLQYNLAHAHFALAEFDDAARQFQDLLEIHIERDEQPGEGVGDIRLWLARSFYHLGRYADASEELQCFILLCDQTDGSGAELVITAQLWLGLTFERLGSHDLAKAQLLGAFEGRTRSLGPEHLDTLACRHHLANFLYKQKAYLEAHEHFQALLLVEDNLSGPEREEAMGTRCMLAFCLAKVRRYDEAQPHLERVLARMVSRSYYRPSHLRDEGLVRYWLGRIALDKRNWPYDKAVHLFQRALVLISRYLESQGAEQEVEAAQQNRDGKFHDEDLQNELVGCRCYLAHTMRFQRQFVAAEQAYRQILDAASVASHEHLVASRCGLADSLSHQGKFIEAKALLEEVVSASSSLQGCRHTGEDLGSCLHILGEIHSELGQYMDARECFQRIVDAVPEKPNVHYNWGRFELGRALFGLRQFDSALLHFDQAYQTAKQVGGLLECETWLSWALCEVGNYDEAEAHLLPAFSQFPEWENRRLSRSEKIVVGRSHFYRGRIALHRHHLAEASRNLEVGVSRLSSFYGLDSPIYLECRYYLAYSLYSRGEYVPARPMFEELERSQCSTEPVPDIRLVLAPYWLGQIARWHRKRTEAEAHYGKCLMSLRGDSLPFHSSISALEVRYNHARSLFRLRKIDESSKIVQEILAELDQAGANNGKDYLYSRTLFGHCLHEAENFKEACNYLTPITVAAGHKRTYRDAELRTTEAVLVDSLSEVDRHDEAVPYLLRLELSQDAISPTDQSLLKSVASYWLGRRAFRNQTRRQEQASQHFTDAQKWLRRLPVQGVRWTHMQMECQHFLARCQLRSKKRADAEGLFRELARQQYESGENAHAVDNQYQLGRSLYQQDKMTEAISAFEKITMDKEVGKLEANAIALSYGYIGRCYFHRKKYNSAKGNLELALKVPDQECDVPETRYYLAKCNFNLGLYDEAGSDFQFCLARSCRVSEVRYWLGKTLFEQGDWDQACSHLHAAALLAQDKNKSPDKYHALFYYGRAKFAAGQYHEALEAFLQCPTEHADNSLVLKLGSCQYYAGRTRYELGAYRQAREQLLHASERYEECKPHPKESILAANFWAARSLVGMGLDVQAKAELEPIVSNPWYQTRLSDETIMLGQYDLARVAYRMKQWTRALELFQAALLQHETLQANKSRLDVEQCRRYLSLTLRAAGQTREASQLYREILDNPQQDEAVKTPRHTLLDVQISLSRTHFCLDKPNGSVENGLENPTGLGHNYSVRRQILLADLAFYHLDFQRAEELYAEVLALMAASDETRRATPVPIAYLQTALAVTLSKLERVEEAGALAAKAIGVDCCNAQNCKSLDGFAEAFPQLLLSAPDNSN